MARRRSSVRLTYDDYVHFPDDKRYEVIDGEAYVVPSPNRRHQEILGRLLVVVANYLDEHPVGSVDLPPLRLHPCHRARTLDDIHDRRSARPPAHQVGLNQHPPGLGLSPNFA